MADTQTAQFVFDPRQMTEAIGSIVGKLDTLDKAMGKIEKSIGGKMEKGLAGVSKTISDTPAKIALLTNVFSTLFSGIGAGLKKAASFIPELGQTFGVVNEIFMKNLLWPLRQLLLPILQKMLNNARDMREMYVRAGVVIANAFKVVLSVVNMLWTFLKSFLKGFTDQFNATFGGLIGGLERIILTFMTRLTIVATFLTALLSPVFEILGKITAMIAQVSFAGFMDGFKATAPTIDQFVKAFKSLGELIDKYNGKFDILNRLLSAIKLNFTLMGAAVGLMLQPIIKMIDLFVLADKLISAKEGQRGGILQDFWKEQTKGAKEGWAAFSGSVAESGKGVIFGTKPKEIGPKQKDAFISKDGRVTPISDGDNILAFKGSTPPGGGGSVTVSVGGINIQVTEGSAKQAGINFGEGVAEQLSKALRQKLFRQAELREAF